MRDFLFVGGGSLLGGVGRYYLGGIVLHLFPATRFPLSTLFVNFLGCLVIGIIAGLAEHGMLSPNFRLFLITGFLGGFTTFSAFGFETVFLMRTDNMNLALLNIVLSVAMCLAAVFVGMRISLSLCNTL